MAQGHAFDALVLVTNCDKIIPGMAMAAARLNIPSIVVSGGPMLTGRLNGKDIDLNTVFETVGKHIAGTASDADLLEVEGAACPGCGSCSGMFTANSMNCLCEALGLALPMNGTLLATSADRKTLYRRAAERIVKMVLEQDKKGEGHGLLPREICTHDAIDNAMVLDMAMGGSTNTVLHILAIAREAGVEYDIKRIDELSHLTPNLCKIAPSSSYHVEDCHNSGGIHTILGAVNRGRPGLLKLDCPTVTGKTLGENIADYDIRTKTVEQEVLEMSAVTAGGARTNEGMKVERTTKSVRDLSPEKLGFDPFDCIREAEKAYSPEGGLSILYGNLAPKGSVVKTAGVRPEMMKHTGPAVIFDSEVEAYEGIVNGKVKAGDVVVIRYEGPRGGPGMVEMLAPTTAIKGMKLDDSVALITDGRFSGGTAGACIGHISPEAAAGGPIALLEAGDIVEIDIPGRKLNVRLSEEELAKRAKNLKLREPRITSGYLSKYASMATSADTGAVLKWN
jgi:dihydroxy-acid dehydratase